MLYSALWTCYCFDSDFHTKELSTLIEANFAQLLQSFRFSLRFVKRRSSQKTFKVFAGTPICIKIEHNLYQNWAKINIPLSHGFFMISM